MRRFDEEGKPLITGIAAELFCQLADIGGATPSRTYPLFCLRDEVALRDLEYSIGSYWLRIHPEYLKVTAERLLKTGVRLLYHTRLLRPLMDGATITSAELLTKSGVLSVHAAAVVDATGDGDVAAFAGVPFETGDQDGVFQPMSMMFTVTDARFLLFICASSSAVSDQEASAGMEVKRFHSLTGFSCWTYVLSSEKGTVLIDPGSYGEALSAHLEALGGVDAILLTHGHWDHARALDRIIDDCPQTPVYINRLESAFLTDPQLNCFGSDGIALQIHAEVTLLDEGYFDIGGYAVRMILAPGHTMGSSVYHFPQEHVLFAGDSIGYTSTFRPTGSAG